MTVAKYIAGSLLLAGLLLFLVDFIEVVVVLSMLFFIPQILRTGIHGWKNSFDLTAIGLIALARLVYVGYFFMWSSNLANFD
jgi:hypothetical protein